MLKIGSFLQKSGSISRVNISKKYIKAKTAGVLDVQSEEKPRVKTTDLDDGDEFLHAVEIQKLLNSQRLSEDELYGEKVEIADFSEKKSTKKAQKIPEDPLKKRAREFYAQF